MPSIYPALIFALMVVLQERSTAQDIRFRHLGMEEGLSQNVVNCILKDNKEFIWFGTQDGLNRYDGYEISVFKHNPSDTRSISGNYIYCLYEDREGMLWIGTNGWGLNRYDPYTGKFRRFYISAGQGSASNQIRTVLEDEQGMIWIGTEEGLYTLNQKTGKISQQGSHSSDIKDFRNYPVWSLKTDPSGKLWIGTNGRGLYSYDKKTGKFKSHLLLNALGKPVYENSHKIRDLVYDTDGMLWIATDNGGLGLFDTKKEEYLSFFIPPRHHAQSTSNKRVTCIAQDRKNSNILWVGTLGEGLNRFDKEKKIFHPYFHEESNPHSLISNDVKSLFADHEGAVWVGSLSEGVSVYFPGANKFRHYRKKGNTDQSLKSNIVFSLLPDRDGILWIGSDGAGAIAFDRKKNSYTHYPELGKSSDNKTILSLYEDKDGLIWAGTWGGGINTYDKKTGTVTKYGKNTPGAPWNESGTVMCITQDRKGTIWAGTYGGGLFSFDKASGKFSGYTVKNGLGSNIIFCIYEDNKGNLWIGTEGGGITIWDAKSGIFTRLAKSGGKNSLSSNTVNCIYQDKNDIFWIGTTNGLNRYDERKKEFIHYYESDGLPNDFIYSILPDKDGYLWMSTNKGVSRFNPEIENTEGSAFINYDVNDGLQQGEFNQGAYCKSKDGEIFFGGVNGINAFFPEEVTAKSSVPPVYITSFKKFGKEAALDTSILYKKYIELSWRDNFFSFDFLTIDYGKPGKNKYSFKMEGLNDDWSPPSSRRYAGYTRVQGGDYIFRVRAMNSEGVWNNEGASIHIRITPPVWQTDWFYALCTVAAVSALFGFIRYRTARIEQEKKVLEQKVEERTRELAQKNKDITSSIRYAQRIQEAILPSVDLIKKYLPEMFVLYRPKDIVSGDFYWFAEKNNKKLLVTADCTGHGVPGALMSMIGHNLLNHTVLEKNILDPGTILTELHRGVQTILKQGSNIIDTSDGMDVAVCCIDSGKRQVSFAGAYRPLFICSKGSIEKIEGDRYSIGGSEKDVERSFTTHTRFLEKGDMLYMFSDGYADQFGGEHGKKFMVKRMAELFLSVADKNPEDQTLLLNQAMENWKGDNPQVDDVLVIGVKV